MLERMKQNWKLFIKGEGSARERVAAYRKELRRMSKETREKAVRGATELIKASKEIKAEDSPKKRTTPTTRRQRTLASKKKTTRKKKATRG
jgi:hypothetical protein